jgi:hypothetical protein
MPLPMSTPEEPNMPKNKKIKKKQKKNVLLRQERMI